MVYVFNLNFGCELWKGDSLYEITPFLECQQIYIK